MLKCGQRNNENYTFGISKEEKREIKVSVEQKCCSSCGVCVTGEVNYCPQCGEKL